MTFPKAHVLLRQAVAFLLSDLRLGEGTVCTSDQLLSPLTLVGDQEVNDNYTVVDLALGHKAFTNSNKNEHFKYFAELGIVGPNADDQYLLIHNGMRFGRGAPLYEFVYFSNRTIDTENVPPCPCDEQISHHPLNMIQFVWDLAKAVPDQVKQNFGQDPTMMNTSKIWNHVATHIRGGRRILAHGQGRKRSYPPSVKI